MKMRIARAPKSGEPANSCFQNSFSIIDPQVQLVVLALWSVDNILQGKKMLQGKAKNLKMLEHLSQTFLVMNQHQNK